MNVVPFTRGVARALRSWSPHELEALVSVYEAQAAASGATGWEVGATELDDPQFHVFGPAPDHDCIVTISRVGRVYVLEDGLGRVLDEGLSLDRITAQARVSARWRKPAGALARIILGLTALRLAVEERIEPLIGESEELMLRFVPQIAMLI